MRKPMSENADLPISRMVLTQPLVPCPYCRKICKKHSIGTRTVFHCGICYKIEYGKYYCRDCIKFFSQKLDHLVNNHRRFSREIEHNAKVLLADKSKTLVDAQRIIAKRYKVWIGHSTLHDWKVEIMYEPA